MLLKFMSEKWDLITESANTLFLYSRLRINYYNLVPIFYCAWSEGRDCFVCGVVWRTKVPVKWDPEYRLKTTEHLLHSLEMDRHCWVFLTLLPGYPQCWGPDCVSFRCGWSGPTMCWIISTGVSHLPVVFMLHKEPQNSETPASLPAHCTFTCSLHLYHLVGLLLVH